MWSVGKNDPLKRASPDAGFTLLELLVVMAIMALAYGLAVPIYSRLLPSVTLNSTAENVVSDLRRARLKAILSGKSVAFILKDNGAGYYLPDLEIDKDTNGIALSFHVRARQRIIFTPDGKNGGFKLLLTTDGREKKISSDWVTGRISVMGVEP